MEIDRRFGDTYCLHHEGDDWGSDNGDSASETSAHAIRLHVATTHKMVIFKAEVAFLGTEL
jgi:hypothetical protein